MEADMKIILHKEHALPLRLGLIHSVQSDNMGMNDNVFPLAH